MKTTKPPQQLKRSLGFWSAISIVVGTIIGSGIFFKQASVLNSAHSSTMALLAWVLGGVITLTGGLTIAEIAAQMPYTGGLYVYIEKIYGRLAGFLAGWMQIIVYGPALLGAVASFIGILLTNFFGLGNQWRIPLAIISLLVVGSINFLGNKVGAAFSVATTIGKLIPIAAIIIFGLFFGDNNALGQTVSQISSESGNFGVAVLSALFAYEGWILVANLGGEMKNPQKVLPKAITIGISIVLLVYALITVGIFRFVPADMIQKMGQNTAAYFAVQAFGNIGGKLLTIGILISMLGAMNGQMITYPRIVYAMAKRGDLPFVKALTYVTPKTKSPVIATGFIMAISVVMMVFMDPDKLSNLSIFTIYCFYILAFYGIFLLRKNKFAKRPFSTPLYPITPMIAIGGGMFAVVSQIVHDPLGVLLFGGMVILGLPVLFFMRRKARQTENKNLPAEIEED